MEAEMDEELRSHIESRTETNMRAGMSAKEARVAALRQFGSADLIKEQCRDQRGARWVESFFQDIRFGARQLRKNPGYTLVAMLTLALGIGANTFVFSVLNKVYLQPLPFYDPGKLVRVAVQGKARDFQKLSIPEFLDLRGHCGTLSSVSAVRAQGVNLTGVDEPTSLQAALVSAGFFETLGIPPAIGRRLPMALSQQDMQNDNQNVSVIGRLKPGRAIGEAQAEIQLVDGRFRETRRVSPDLGPLGATILTHQIDRGTSLFLGMLTIAVVFVLMIGCVNVASLSLSLSLARRKEIAIRLSLGATRWRVLQQLLFEGLLLGSLGGGSGVLLALFTTSFAASWIGEQARFDRHVLFFSGAITLLAGVVCGLLPAALATRVSLNDRLKDTAHEPGSFVGSFRLRQLFVVVQVAMSLTLLLGTGLIVRSLLRLALTDPGFDPKELLSVQVYLPTEKYMNDNDRTAFFARVFQQLGSTPGVRAVGGTSSFPIYAPTFFRPFRIVGAEDATADLPSEADMHRDCLGRSGGFDADATNRKPFVRCKPERPLNVPRRGVHRAGGCPERYLLPGPAGGFC